MEIESEKRFWEKSPYVDYVFIVPDRIIDKPHDTIKVIPVEDIPLMHGRTYDNDIGFHTIFTQAFIDETIVEEHRYGRDELGFEL